MRLNQNIQQSFSHLEPLVREYASEFERIYKEKLRDHDFKATGDLIASIKTNVKVGEDYYLVTFSAKDYWMYVENGREKGKKEPPHEAILNWIRAKKILPREDKGGKLPTGLTDLPVEEQQERLAFAIAKSIGKKGTIKRFNFEGSHLVAETVEELNKQYIPLMQEALQEDAEHYIFEVFDKVVISKLNDAFKGEVNLRQL